LNSFFHFSFRYFNNFIKKLKFFSFIIFINILIVVFAMSEVGAIVPDSWEQLEVDEDHSTSSESVVCRRVSGDGFSVKRTDTVDEDELAVRLQNSRVVYADPIPHQTVNEAELDRVCKEISQVRDKILSITHHSDEESMERDKVDADFFGEGMFCASGGPVRKHVNVSHLKYRLRRLEQQRRTLKNKVLGEHRSSSELISVDEYQERLNSSLDSVCQSSPPHGFQIIRLSPTGQRQTETVSTFDRTPTDSESVVDRTPTDSESVVDRTPTDSESVVGRIPTDSESVVGRRTSGFGSDSDSSSGSSFRRTYTIYDLPVRRTSVDSRPVAGHRTFGDGPPVKRSDTIRDYV
jgi:flagellar basal body-associated protein FliL